LWTLVPGAAPPDHQLEKMKAELKEAHRQAIEDSKLEPVPEIVLRTEMFMACCPMVGRRGSSNATIEFVFLHEFGKGELYRCQGRAFAALPHIHCNR